MILEEFDSDREAVINPGYFIEKNPDFPETCIAVFPWKTFNSILDKFYTKKIAEIHNVDGAFPVYKIIYNGKPYAFFKARLGAASCAGTFEEIIAMGAKRIILTGNCGVLDKKIESCGIIIPNRAIRDEGFSYHYAPSSDYIDVNKKYIPEFEEILKQHGYCYTIGTTWTTDGFYRETKKKIERRKEMGAICVEMECSAVQAVCDFRNVEFFQYLFAGDNLDAPVWDPRSLSGHLDLDVKEKIVMLAFELAEKIEDSPCC